MNMSFACSSSGASRMIGCSGPVQAIIAQPVVQIRRILEASLNGLALTVDGALDQWTARVIDPVTRKPLYTAQRVNPMRAKAAAVDFALAASPDGVAQSPEAVAVRLPWAERLV